MQNSFQTIRSPYRTNETLNTSNNDSIYYIEEEETEWDNCPDEWSDDVRMNALFAPFRNRDLNPLHYDNKIKFWKQVIISFCNEKQLIQFDQKKLENYFIRQGKKPKCLELVLKELEKEKSILTREDCLKPRPGLLGNIFNKLVWSPITWSTSYFFKASSSNGNSTTTYFSSSFTPTSPKSKLENSFSCQSPQKETNSSTFVLPNLVEQKSFEVLKKLQSQVVYRNVDSVIEYEKLSILVKETLNEKDLELIIKYLEVNQKILVVNSEEFSRKFIKFCLNANQNVQPLNEVEISFLKLKDVEQKLEFESNKLTEQIDSLNNDIKTQMNLGNKNTALKILKKRKNLEKSLDNKDKILNNIETMIMSIQQADTNKVTVDVLTKGASALKEATKGLNIDQIDDTMCEIQDIYNQNNEIEETLARTPVGIKSVFDDDELNNELDELLAEDAKEKKLMDNVDSSFNMNELLNNLPSIPNDSPKMSMNTTKPYFSFKN